MSEWRKYLHKNEFFASTPLSGWAYIYGAKSTKQIVLWYFFIILFICLTAYNVHQVTSYYLKSPTKFSVHLQSSREDVFLQNFTLSVSLDLRQSTDDMDFSIFDIEDPQSKGPPPTWNFALDSEGNEKLKIFRDFVCDGFYWFDGDERDLYIYFFTENENYGKEWEMKLRNMDIDKLIKIKNEPELKLVNFADETIFGEWKTEMEASKKEIIDYWLQVLSMPQREQNRKRIQQDLNGLHNSILKTRGNDTFANFMLLDAMLKGYEHSGEHKGLEAIRGRTVSVNDLLETFQITPLQLLQSTLKDLSKVLHIEMNPTGSALLKGWSYDSSLASQTFTFSIIVPENAKELIIDVHSFLTEWQDHVMSAGEIILKEHLAYSEFLKSDKMAGSTDMFRCPQEDSEFGMDEVIEELRVLVLKGFYNYIRNTIVYLSLPSGQTVSVGALRNVSVSLNPSSLVSSETKDCTNETSYEVCVDNCLDAMSQEQCACVPWMSSSIYTSGSTAVCDQYCLNQEMVDECNDKCDESMANACYYYILQSSNTAGGLTENLSSIATISMGISEVNSFYTEIMTEYEVTFISFLALLGGSIEFWCFIDVLGLIHIIIYILTKFIQCIHSSSQIDPEQSETVPDIASVEQELDSAVEEINAKLSKICQVKVGFLKWLQGNKFYGESPVIGFNMIMTSKSRIETVLWYGIMMVFGIFVIHSVSGTIDGYLNRSTHVSFIPTRQVPPQGLPNFTAQIRIPLIYLAPYPIDLPYDVTKEMTQKQLEGIDDWLNEKYDYGGEFDAESYYATYSEETMQQFEMVFANKSWADLLSLNQDHQHVESLSDPNLVKEMQFRVEQSMADFEQFVNDRKKFSWLEAQQKMPKLFMGPLTNDTLHGLLYKLILLDSVSTGVKPGEQLGFTNDVEDAAQVLEQLGSSVEELHADAVNHLGELLAASLSGDVVAALSNISFNYEMKELMLQFDFRLPPKMEQIEVKFSSLFGLWYQELFYYLLELTSRIFKSPGGLDRYAYNLFILDSRAVASPHTPMSLFMMKARIQLIFSNGQILDLQPSFAVAKTPALEYAVLTRWSHIANMTDCDQSPYEWCKESCLLKAHRETCNCVPWQMQHLDPTASLCQLPCVHEKPEMCYTECENIYFCAMQEYLFSQTRLPYDTTIDNSLFMQTRLALRKSLHIKLIEENADSLGNLFAAIGGLCDFWLGLNVIAVVHFIIYVLQATVSYVQRKKHDQANQLKELEELKTELGILHKSITSKMDKLLELKVSEVEKEQKTQHLSWLKENDFYDQTPITGFSFISAAEMTIEAAFWWFLIILFSVFTVMNVTSAIMAYREKPTQVGVSLANSDELQLESFSLTFRWSMMDFIQGLPIIIDSDPEENPFIRFKQKGIDEQMICAISSEYMDDILPIVDMLKGSVYGLEEWTIKEQDHAKHFFSTVETLDEWHEIFDTASKDLVNFFDQVASLEKGEAIEQFLQIIHKPMERVENSQMFFLALESLKHDQPSEHFYELMISIFAKDVEDKSTAQYLTENKDSFLNSFDDLNNMNILDLYAEAENLLSKALHIQVLDQPDAIVHFKDWNYQWNPEGLLDQLITIVVMLPSNRSRTGLHLTVRSYLFMYYQYIFDAIHTYLDGQGKLKRSMCDEPNFKELQTFSLEDMFGFINTATAFDTIYFETQSGDTYTLDAAQTIDAVTEPQLALDMSTIAK